MYRLVLVMSVGALVLAVAPFVAALGWFGNALWLLSPWVLAAIGAAVLLSLGAVLVALALAMWAGDWLWIWGLGLLLPLGLFGWLAMLFAPPQGAILAFLPPIVAGAFGWQGMILHRRTASNEATGISFSARHP
jgi:hypothetical protein